VGPAGLGAPIFQQQLHLWISVIKCLPGSKPDSLAVGVRDLTSLSSTTSTNWSPS
ncbi:unnamed protein product, partial [Gulo gulo]